jgi:O-antigen ligase
MPIAQPLKAARGRGEPAAGFGGGPQAWRARLEESSAALAPAALVAGLALAGGGYDLTTRHIAALLTWLVVVALLLLGAGSKAPLTRPFLWSVASIAFLALWSALSASWSGSAELSAIEADRTLAYLGVFLAAFLIAQTERRRQRFAEGLTIGVAAVVVLGLGSRLLPDLFDVANGLDSGAQLRYPLDYWNANGVVFATAVALLLWLGREATSAALRWLAVAFMPAALLGLYFTFSRGGLLALAVAVGAFLALSRDRLWLLATVSLAALGALPAVLAAQARTALEENVGPEAIGQGHEVLWILLAGTAVAVALVALLRRFERRGGGLTGRMVEVSRSPRLLKAVAAGLAVLALGATVAVGGRAWDRFSSPDIQAPSEPVRNFSDLSGAGRYDFWRVAFDSLGEEPLAGVGAGSYEFAWERHREIEQPVHDAHSLYFEAFAELGVVGGIAVLAMVAVLLWAGFGAWRSAPPARRDRQAVLLATMLAFAVGAAFDWFWEIPGVGVVFFLAAGATVAARSAQLTRRAEADGARREDRGFRFAVAGLAAAWISAIALIGPLLVERELDASRDAAATGNLASAVEHADTARSIEPWAASPYVQLALIAEAQRDYGAAAERLTQAIDREDRNWQLYYLRSRVERADGDAAAAEADAERARELNPREECLDGIPDCG